MSKAIVIHSPTPNAIQVLKYVTRKYGLECSDEKDAAELIRLAKLVSRYAVKYRRFVAEKVCEKLGVKPVSLYDSSHTFVDDDNVYRFASQRAKKGDTPIIVDEKTGRVFVFEGKGSSDWKNTVTGTHSFSISSKRLDIDEFAESIAPSAELKKTLSISE